MQYKKLVVPNFMNQAMLFTFILWVSRSRRLYRKKII
jgi:hypothetical protein